VAVARKIGQEPERVFKTLVTEGKTTGLNVFVIPCNVELDLKKAALAAGDKYIEMIKSRELEPKTGYVHGGCSPCGTNCGANQSAAIFPRRRICT
jgi:Cys-tRNA(Pro)/Cys-tRNA(Cys) deacylase